jgi:hypothetical protein
MRKIVLAICSVAAFLAMMVPAAGASAASAAVTCSTQYTLLNINAGWGWSSGTSPHTLYEHTSGTQTGFCRQGSNPDFQFVQYGTSRCLYLQTSGREIVEGNCADLQAKWHQINLRSVVGLEEVELESEYNSACIYEQGVNAKFTYNPCSSTNGNDQWLFP